MFADEMANTQAHGPARSSLDQGAPLIRLICQIAGARSLIDDARVGLARPGVIAAVQRHDTPAIFNWLIDALSYQGVSDSIADGDIVDWIDGRLANVEAVPGADRPARLRQALLEPLGHVYGVSNKVLAMAMSELLLAGDAKRPAWIEAGAVMIAIDTLVHNFLHRSGILR